MKKIALASGFVFSAVILAACTYREPVVDVNARCGDRTVKLNQRASKLSARPNHVNLCGGDTLTVEIVPPVAGNAARSREAGAGNPAPAPWLNEQSADGASIVIDVPANSDDLEAGQIYKYELEVDGVGLLDPTIGIIRR